MTKTEQLLKEAFSGESQANRKYLAFAHAADREGFTQVAKLFRAAADAETVHALNHLRVLKGVRSTKENLQEAISGETHEFQKMYPEMIKVAENEANRDAVRTFNYANDVEKVHAELYQGLLDSLGKDQETYPYYVCPVCGYTAEREAPDTCPICGAKGRVFREIN
ncbi:rubrerythrin family protein [Chloroflexota bacterium]